MSPKIYAIGESILDIVFRDFEVRSAIPGGSMLNSCVSLGRLGLPVNLISEVGVDYAGNLILNFLKSNGVLTDCVSRFTEGKTAVAMASLNGKGDAEYDFYKSYPRKRLDIHFPDFCSADYFLFGSFFGIDSNVHAKVYSLAEEAHENGALLVYDPNFRKSYMGQLAELLPLILKNMRLAHIIRAGDEDLKNVFGHHDVLKIQSTHNLHDKIFVKTCNESGVYLYRPNCETVFLPSHEIEAVSTIGAGDNFNAGLLSALFKKEIRASGLHSTSHEDWQDMLKTGVSFATEVCLRYENYISKQFAQQYR